MAECMCARLLLYNTTVWWILTLHLNGFTCVGYMSWNYCQLCYILPLLTLTVSVVAPGAPVADDLGGSNTAEYGCQQQQWQGYLHDDSVSDVWQQSSGQLGVSGQTATQLNAPSCCTVSTRSLAFYISAPGALVSGSATWQGCLQRHRTDVISRVTTSLSALLLLRRVSDDNGATRFRVRCHGGSRALQVFGPHFYFHDHTAQKRVGWKPSSNACFETSVFIC